MLARSRAFLHKRFRFRHLFLLSHLFENRSSVVLFSVLTLSLSLSLLSISICVCLLLCSKKRIPGPDCAVAPLHDSAGAPPSTTDAGSIADPLGDMTGAEAKGGWRGWGDVEQRGLNSASTKHP